MIIGKIDNYGKIEYINSLFSNTSNSSVSLTLEPGIYCIFSYIPSLFEGVPTFILHSYMSVPITMVEI